MTNTADQHDPAQGGIVPPGLELVHLTLSKNQAALIVVCLMEQSKQAATIADQMDWTRLALGINDVLTSTEEEDHGHDQPD